MAFQTPKEPVSVLDAAKAACVVMLITFGVIFAIGMLIKNYG